MKIINKKNILLVLVLLWMGVIYYFSSCNGNISSNQSGFITKYIIELFNIKPSSFIGSNIGLIIRKTAHISEYFILCMLLTLYLKCLNINNSKIIVYSIIISYLYVCSDEIHQMFVSNRGASFIDTLIDSIGIIIWIMLYKLKGIKK